MSEEKLREACRRAEVALSEIWSYPAVRQDIGPMTHDLVSGTLHRLREALAEPSEPSPPAHYWGPPDADGVRVGAAVGAPPSEPVEASQAKIHRLEYELAVHVAALEPYILYPERERVEAMQAEIARLRPLAAERDLWQAKAESTERARDQLHRRNTQLGHSVVTTQSRVRELERQLADHDAARRKIRELTKCPDSTGILAWIEERERQLAEARRVMAEVASMPGRLWLEGQMILAKYLSPPGTDAAAQAKAAGGEGG